MKKLVILLCVLTIISISYIVYKSNLKEPSSNEIENILESLDFDIKDSISIGKSYIYGNHLNINGKIYDNNIKNIELFIHSTTDEIVQLTLNKVDDYIEFSLSNKINLGLNLDKYTNHYYLLFLKVTDNNQNIEYYSLDNINLIYYTITTNNKNYKVEINTDNKYNTMAINSSITNDETYDVIIDPGHGGIDSGACYNRCEINERTFTPDIAKRIKEKLEEKGLKVALTWDIDRVTNNDVIPTYGENSRTGRAYETHAKLLLSVHLNSSSTKTGSGYEIYTPYNVDYSFAKELSDNLKSISNPSNNKYFQVYDGVYTRTFSSYDLNSIINERKNKNLEPLNISNKTNYYYMIRETGGEITDAYVDGTTDNKNSNNPYRDYLVAAESYIIELGYITNINDINSVKNNMDTYATIISNAIINKLKK